LEQIYDDEREIQNGVDDVNYEGKMGNILSVEPSQQKIIVGKVTKINGQLCIDGKIYFTLEEVEGGKILPLGSLVKCKAVEWSRKNYEPLAWRALEVSPSNFLQYTADK